MARSENKQLSITKFDSISMRINIDIWSTTSTLSFFSHFILHGTTWNIIRIAILPPSNNQLKITNKNKVTTKPNYKTVMTENKCYSMMKTSCKSVKLTTMTEVYSTSANHSCGTSHHQFLVKICFASPSKAIVTTAYTNNISSITRNHPRRPLSIARDFALATPTPDIKTWKHE